MNYEAILMDPVNGHHKRGAGPDPARAVLAAFRQIVKMQLLANGDAEEVAEEKAGSLTSLHVLNTFYIVNLDDEYYEEPKTLKEEVHDLKVIVRVDRTSEIDHVPCGFVRHTV